MLVDFYKWKIVTSNTVCMDRWYVMIFSCFKRTVSIHFDGLFACSKGYFNRLSGHESFLILYLKGKYRIDVNERGKGGQLLTLKLAGYFAKHIQARILKRLIISTCPLACN